MADQLPDEPWRPRAVVVFHGDGGGFWPAFLGRDGFRHCFVVVPSGDYWVLVDGRAGSPRLEVIGSTTESAAAYYRREGFTVVEVSPRQRPPLWWPWMFHNCVGATKAVLGVRAPWVWTPWQLYRHLRGRSQKSEVRSQKTGIRSQMTAAPDSRFLTSDF